MKGELWNSSLNEWCEWLYSGGPLGIVVACEPAQCNHCTGRCHASVFQQHYPTRKRPPRTTKCAQVPHDVRGDNAHSPDDDQKRRGRRQKWQQPEEIPWEYDGCAQKRYCHWPGKYVRR